MKKFLSSAIAAVLAVFLVFTSACVPGGNANVSYTVTVVNTKEETIEDVKVMSTQYNSEGSTPTTPIIIESIRVDTKGMYYEIPDMLEPFDRTSLY